MLPLRAFCLATACAAAAISAPSGPAWAQPAVQQPTLQQRAEARTLASQGRAALKEQRFADAIDPLRRSVELDPNPQIKLDLGRALDGAGKLVEASTVLHEVENTAGQDKLTLEAARKLVGEVEARIPWIQVSVKGPKEAKILIDGKETDASFEVPIDPGEHEVQAEADGFLPAEKKVKLAEGEHLEVELTLDPEEEEEKPVAPATPPPTSSFELPGTPVLVAFGVGAAGVAVGSLFGILAFTETSSAKERCDGNRCPNDSEVVDARDAALRNGTISTVGFVLGGVGIAAGVTMMLTGIGNPPPPAAPAAQGLQVRPWVGAGQAGVVGTF